MLLSGWPVIKCGSSFAAVADKLPNSKLLGKKSAFNNELLQQKHIWGRSLACPLKLCL